MPQTRQAGEMMRRLNVMMVAVTALVALLALSACGDDETLPSLIGPPSTPAPEAIPDDCPAPSCSPSQRVVLDSTVRCGFRCETDIVVEEDRAEPICQPCAIGERWVQRDDHVCGYICQLPSQEQVETDLEGYGDGPACAGACAQGTPTVCTCAAADPCGWADNGQCDFGCAAFEDSFDDDVDCCDGACFTGETNACTCAAGDSCNYETDNACQDVAAACGEFTNGLTSESPQGDCDASRYTPCSCAPSDPCGWKFDGVCDGPCADLLDEAFDDGFDCE